MKTQSKQRIKQLLKQFPAIEKMHRLLDKDIKVRINVKTADHSLMYWYANNVLGNRHFLIGDKGQIGKRSELAFAVGENNEILKEMKWSQGSYQFIKNFADTVAPELIHQIIIVSRYDWYTEPTAAEKERDVEHGALCSREIYFTVHRKPRHGFQSLINTASVSSNVELTERSLSLGLIHEDWQFHAASTKLGALAQSFENRVYETGLKEMVHVSTKKGMSGVFNGVNLMSWCMCGRIMITFEVPNARNPKINDTFTIIGNEPPNSGNFGWRSIYATADRATEIVNKVISAWETVPALDRAHLFHDDKDVMLDAIAAMKAGEATEPVAPAPPSEPVAK